MIMSFERSKVGFGWALGRLRVGFSIKEAACVKSEKAIQVGE